MPLRTSEQSTFLLLAGELGVSGGNMEQSLGVAAAAAGGGDGVGIVATLAGVAFLLLPAAGAAFLLPLLLGGAMMETTTMSRAIN